MELVPIIGGVALGVVAALPSALAMRRSRDRGIGHGVAAVVAAFALMQGVMVALLFVARPAVAPVGIAATLSFLVAICVAAYRS